MNLCLIIFLFFKSFFNKYSSFIAIDLVEYFFEYIIFHFFPFVNFAPFDLLCSSSLLFKLFVYPTYDITLFLIEKDTSKYTK